MEDKADYKTKRRYHDALDDILDRPIAFNPAFKRITGSSNAAILLSQGFFWTKRTSDPDGWFWKTRQEWMEETALTEAELDGAREKCRACGVWEEKLAGVPATLHYRINKQKVYELLGVQIPTFPESGFPQNSQIPENPESGNYGNFNKESENTSENTSDFSETKKPDLVDGILDFHFKGQELERKGKTWKGRENFPESLWPLADACAGIFGPPAKKYQTGWLAEISDWFSRGATPVHVQRAWVECGKWTTQPTSPVGGFGNLVRRIAQTDKNEKQKIVKAPEKAPQIISPEKIREMRRSHA